MSNRNTEYTVVSFKTKAELIEQVKQHLHDTVQYLNVSEFIRQAIREKLAADSGK